MAVTSNPSPPAIARLVRAAPVVIALLLVVFLSGPRAAPVLVFPLALSVLAWTEPADLQVRLLTPPAALIAALGLAIWGAVSLAWAAKPLDGAGKVAMLVTLAAAVWIAYEGFRSADAAVLDRLARAILVALIAGGGFLLIEELFSHPIKRFIYVALPFARLPEKHLGIEDGMIVRIGNYLTKRNMAALCFVLWPALHIAWPTRPRPQSTICGALAIAAAVVAIVLATHETSLLATIVAVCVLALALMSPRIAFGAVMAGWLAATLLIVPIARGCFAYELHLSRSIPEDGRQRLTIWGYTAEQVSRRPLTGVGIASTKPLDLARGKLEAPPGFSYPLRTGPHAHNVYLEIWYELGAIGALLLMALGICLLRAIRPLPGASMAFALASFASAAITAALSWSAWQTWFMAAFAISLILNLLAAEIAWRKAGIRR